MTNNLGQKLQVKQKKLENFCAALSIDGSGQGNDNPTNASIDGAQGVFDLRQHATTDGAIGLVLLEIGAGDGGDNRIVVVGIAQYAFLLETVDERYIVIGS